MNETKEILDLMKFANDDIMWCDTLTLNVKQCHLLLDYIINLQEEKKEMKDGWQQEIYDKNKVLNDWLEDERKINILQQRIDKAIEYINYVGWTTQVEYEYLYTCELDFRDKILDILRGDE